MTLRFFLGLIMNSRVVDPTLDTDVLVIMADPRPSRTLAERSKAPDCHLRGSGGVGSNSTIGAFLLFLIKSQGSKSKVLYNRL